MLLIVETAFLVLVILLWWFKNDQSRYSKYPPGPPRLPVIGNLLHLLKYHDHNPAVTFKRLAQKYGDVMFIKVGVFEAVIVTSPEAIHELYHSDKANGRYQNELVKDRHDHRNLGVIWGWGEPWQLLRRFTIRNLRDFGFGKSNTMDVVINEEIEKFHEFLDNEVGNKRDGILHVEDLFTMTVVNGLWRLVSGTSYDLDDPKIRRWVHLNEEWLKTIKVGMDISDSYPWLRDWFPGWTGRTAQRNMYKELYRYGKELLDSHRKVKGDCSEPETFIDTFVQKIDAEKGNPDSCFNDDQFILTILDLFVAGSESSSNTLNFGILYMLLHPEVQEKVQAEIDREVPKGTPIDSSMKSRLPHTSATVLETYRYTTLLPIPAPREAIEDFYFRGYLIKKGTALMFNVHALHFNEELWGDPGNFRPERFLTPEGTVDLKIAERLKSFGAGPRYCLGQSLAETSVYLYFASTLRKYRFEKVPGTNPTMEPVVGLTCSPRPYDVRVTKRL